VLHDFTFHDLLSSQHPDILAYWLPTYCFLGKTLAAAHIPAWDPFVMSGVPFAADPQSGWAYLPAMLLFSTLRCDVAMRWMIIGQPILAGLGVYWFARSEGLSRPAATSGGLVASLGLAGSRLGLFLPFPGALAWTALTLAACSRFVHAKAWSGRLVWALLTVAAWGQLAAAHFAQGLLIGTGALLAYLAARMLPELRGKRRTGRDALGLAAVLAGAAALLNLAFLVPRLAYWSQTSVGVGYSAVKETAGLPAIAWPLKFATSPGTYLGAAALALAFAGFWSRRYRSLAIAFGAFGALGYLLGLQAVANVLAPLLRHVPGLNFYVHYPSRFALALFLSIPVLVALGVQAWAEARSARERLWMAAPGLAVWGVLPIALGVHPARLALLGLGAIAGGLALVAGARRPTLALLVPFVLAIELSANGLLGLGASPRVVDAAVRSPALKVGDIMAGWVEPLASPTVDAGEYLAAGPLSRALPGLEGARYLTFVPGLLTSRGYLTAQEPEYWPLLANQRGLLFRVQDVQGYNPVQLLRYWTFVRAMSPSQMDYNAAIFPDPPAVALDLLQVRYVLSAAAGPPRPGATRVATQGEWAVWELPGAAPRASVLSNWRTVGSPAEALREMTAPGFDPRARVVLERDPGLGPPAPAGAAGASAAFTSHGSQASTVAVSTPVASVVLIRTPYERYWHASVDGHPVPIIPADYVDQAVPVPAGEHTISLRYDNPTIGVGLAGSGVMLAAMLGAAWWLRRRERGAGRVGRSERAPSVTDPRTAP
jgi:hypothetical protein